MNKDQVKGLVDEVNGKVNGKVKEAAGVLLDDKELEIKGNVEKNLGKVQGSIGDFKENIKDRI